MRPPETLPSSSSLSSTEPFFEVLTSLSAPLFFDGDDFLMPAMLGPLCLGLSVPIDPQGVPRGHTDCLMLAPARCDSKPKAAPGPLSRRRRLRLWLRRWR